MTPGVVVINRTFTASGLIPHTNYTFRVAGVNDAGIGPFNTIGLMTKEDGRLNFNIDSYPQCKGLSL